MTFRLWSLNRVLRWAGVTVVVKSPPDEHTPTLVTLEFIGWGARALAADHGRTDASGYARSPEDDERYMRCVARMDAAFTEAVSEEYGT